MMVIKQFLKEKWKDILVAVIAGLLVWFIPKVFEKFLGTSTDLLSIQIVAVFLIVISLIIFLVTTSNKKNIRANEELIEKYKEQIIKYEEQINQYNQLGIIKVLSSTIEGEGSTVSVLKEVDKSFFFMGIAGTKWIQKASNFNDTMRKLAAVHGSKICFILLNPMSVVARNISMASKKNDYYMKDLILENLRILKKCKEELGLNLEVKLFSHEPVFRIAIVDDEKIYFGQYRVNDDGENLSQIVLQGKDTMLYREISEYYSVAWDCLNLQWLDFDKLEDSSYLNSLK